jgi:hypothetical protein
MVHFRTRDIPMQADEPAALTMSVPEAARRYYAIKSKSAAYAAAARGEIPTIRVGGKLRVPIRAMEAILDRIADQTARDAGARS